MRRIILASLLSSFALTAAAATGKTPSDADATVRPVSTGVTSPRLVYSTRIRIAASELPATSTASRVVLKFNLDTTGSPQSIQVVEPLTQEIDARVVDAVRKFRWSPAVLNNQAVAIPINFVVEVQR